MFPAWYFASDSISGQQWQPKTKQILKGDDVFWHSRNVHVLQWFSLIQLSWIALTLGRAIQLSQGKWQEKNNPVFFQNVPDSTLRELPENSWKPAGLATAFVWFGRCSDTTVRVRWDNLRKFLLVKHFSFALAGMASPSFCQFPPGVLFQPSLWGCMCWSIPQPLLFWSVVEDLSFVFMPFHSCRLLQNSLSFKLGSHSMHYLYINCYPFTCFVNQLITTHTDFHWLSLLSLAWKKTEMLMYPLG